MDQFRTEIQCEEAFSEDMKENIHLEIEKEDQKPMLLLPPHIEGE